MSGQNVNILGLPPGIVKNATPYAVGDRWANGNQVRWRNEMLTPVEGWIKTHTFSATRPMRDMFSWRDYLRAPWAAVGSADKLYSMEILGVGDYTVRDITPAGLTWSDGPMQGYGSEAYGQGPYGMQPHVLPVDSTALWSMDNFGRLLVAVHSQDGRLFSYDPTTPATIAAPVAGAPVDNTLVIATEEEHLMLMGGDGNPRRIAWSSQRDITDWTPDETNSAGELELQSDGTIMAAVRVQGGILVLTDTDAHIVEYLGPPFYYGRRKITEESSCLGKNCVAAYPQGAIWVGAGNFWHYDGKVSRMPCSLQDDIFFNSNLSLPSRMFLSPNVYAQEIWLSYPGYGQPEPDRYALVSYAAQQHWSLGDIPRTAWLNPVWQSKPLAVYDQDLYEHELGMLADGETRVGDVYAETGDIEIGEGDRCMRVDRIYPDFGLVPPYSGATDPGSVVMNLSLRQAPLGPSRDYGPVALDTDKGYTVVRFRARQMNVRIEQANDNQWFLGKVRARMKESSRR